MVKIKICGITNLEDAMHSVEAGCDALGFVFYKKSPRYITPEKAAEIIKQLPPHIIKMGVFVNARVNTVRSIARKCKLDVLQFHGNESPEFCQKFSSCRVIKAFRVKDSLDLKAVQRYKPFAYLFDTFVESKLGGTGEQFDWKLIRHICDIKRPVFLSGGLTEKNVKLAIDSLNPDWVDVSSSLESKPGKKDHKKITRFIKAVRK
jgi:phosphoribosylanthranilate isomerase